MIFFCSNWYHGSYFCSYGTTYLIWLHFSSASYYTERTYGQVDCINSRLSSFLLPSKPGHLAQQPYYPPWTSRSLQMNASWSWTSQSWLNLRPAGILKWWMACRFREALLLSWRLGDCRWLFLWFASTLMLLFGFGTEDVFRGRLLCSHFERCQLTIQADDPWLTAT